MATGTVKWFNDAKGFGFIEPDGGEGDAFAHFSAIAMEGFKTLKQGARVQFELVRGPKGWLAMNIHADGVLAPIVTRDAEHSDVGQLPSTARVHAPQFRALGPVEAPLQHSSQ